MFDAYTVICAFVPKSDIHTISTKVTHFNHIQQT